MGLNKNYVICIFMNINENDENQDIQRENQLPFEGFRVEYLKDVPCTLRTMPMGASLVRGRPGLILIVNHDYFYSIENFFNQKLFCNHRFLRLKLILFLFDYFSKCL